MSNTKTSLVMLNKRIEDNAVKNIGSKTITYKNPSHPIHALIQPVVSAMKHAKPRIAVIRYQALCRKFNLMKWEQVVVSDIIREACLSKGIAFNREAL